MLQSLGSAWRLGFQDVPWKCPEHSKMWDLYPESPDAFGTRVIEMRRRNLACSDHPFGGLANTVGGPVKAS